MDRWRFTAAFTITGLALGGCTFTDGAGARDELPLLGILSSVPDEDHAVFLEELRAQGWHPGRDLRIVPDRGTLYPDVESARADLGEWLQQDLDLLIAYSTPFAQLAADETRVPGLFMVNDPIAGGLVEDPRRPDGQLTGLTFATPADRTLDLAVRAIGELDHIGYLWPADDPAVPGHRRAVLDAAEMLGIDIVDASFEGDDGVPAAVAELARAEVDAVVLATATGTVRAVDVLEAELDRHGLPAIANTDFAEFAVVVLTPDRAEMRRQLARQTAQLLAGSPVSAVPVEDPRRFVLILNQTQAQALGIPPLDQDLLRQATIVR